MDLSTMRGQVRNSLRDSEKTFITDAEINDWLNEAYRDLATRLKIAPQKQQTEADVAISGNTLPVPADFVDLIHLRLGTNDDVQFVNDDEWNAFKDAGSSPSRTIARIFNNNFEFYPTPDASTAYVLRYYAMPVALAADADVPAIPEILHIKLVHYAKAMGLWKSDEPTLGDRWMQLYEDGLPGRNVGKERAIPGPLQLIPERTAWDDDVGARHI